MTDSPISQLWSAGIDMICFFFPMLVPATFTPLSEIQHALYATKEFEREVNSRMHSCEYSGSKMSQYQVETNKHNELRRQLAILETTFPSIESKVNFDSIAKHEEKGKKQPASPKNDAPMLDTIECDLYLKLFDSASLHCRDLIKDSATDMMLINPRYNDESDVQLEEDDMVWIEVAETPQSLRVKLLQLERAVRHFDDTPDSIIGRGAVMICLKGEKHLFDECMSHLKKLYNDGKLKDWRIISAKVPLLVTHIPYRNVYKLIADMERDLDHIRNNLSGVKKEVAPIATKLETKLKAKIDAEVAEVKAQLVAKLDAFETSVMNDVNMIINALDANGP